MKIQSLFLAGICLGIAVSLPAQERFEWGMAEQKTEPPVQQVSLSLAGYGLPAGGRFSISWEMIDRREVKRSLRKARNFGSLTTIGNKIFQLREDGTLWYSRANDTSSWIKTGLQNGYTWKDSLRGIAGMNGRLYAWSASGKLLRAVHSSDSSLSVSALVIRKNGKTVALIGADVCGLQYAFTKAVKDSLQKRFGIAPEAVLINASHTHFAPVTQEWKAWAPFYHTPDSSYLYGVVQRAMIAAVEKAMQNLSTGRLDFVRGATQIGANRRALANPQKPYDSSLDVLMLRNGNDQLNGLMFLTGCHPVFPNEKQFAYTLSANYPGVARQILREKLPLANSLFLQGCGGDINPVKSDYRVTGRDLATNVLQAQQLPATALTGEISYRFDSVLIPVRFWPREKIIAFREENQMGTDVYAEKNVRWADIMLQHLDRGTAPSYMPVYIQTIAIGNWLLVGLSREVVTEYGINIKNEWPGKLISVAGYCNDVSSYLPIDWHIRTKVYEGYESSFWYAQPDLFPENILQIVMEKVRSVVH